MKDLEAKTTEELRVIARSIGIRQGGPTGVDCDRMTRGDLLEFFAVRRRERSGAYSQVAAQLESDGATDEAAYVREHLV